MDGSDAEFRLHDSIGFHVSQAARLVEREIDEALRPMGLTRAQWCILLAVGEEGLSTPSEISDFVGTDRTATSRALRALEADGYITRANGQSDRRRTEVRLTELGRARMDLAKPNCQSRLDALGQRLTAADQANLLTLLEKLRGL